MEDSPATDAAEDVDAADVVDSADAVDAEAPPLPPPERDTAFLVSAGIALVAMFVLARNLLPAKQDLADTNRKIESLKAERDALAKERDLLEQKEKALKDDPAFIERTLRGQTGMSKPGEFIVR